MKRIRFGQGVFQLAQQEAGDPLSFDTKTYQRPRNTLAPVITSSGTVGAAQSFTAGTWVGSPTIVVVWYVDNQIVQVGGNYTPTILDSGKTLTVLERATAANGLAASSRSAGVVIP